MFGRLTDGMLDPVEVTPMPGRGGQGALTAEPPLAGRLRLIILRMSRRLRREKVGEITPSQLSALTSISVSDGPSLGELATSERIAPPSMTRIVVRLEEDGLVRRRHDIADRRVSRLQITPAGEALLAETRSRRDAYLAVRLQRLDDDERETVARALPILERILADD